MPQSNSPSDKKKLVFWPHPDQEAIISAALNLAKEAVPTQFQTVALEAIAQAYMATGIAFNDWRQALAFDRKHTQDAVAFAQQVSMHLQELCPELMIETTITQRSSFLEYQHHDMGVVSKSGANVVSGASKGSRNLDHLRGPRCQTNAKRQSCGSCSSSGL